MNDLGENYGKGNFQKIYTLRLSLRLLDNRYMDATAQINAKKICHWSKVCHVTSLTLDFIGSQ